MIKEEQIRKFINNELPNIKIGFFREDIKKWFCIFQEDFKFPYISLTEEQIENETVLMN